ncbi:hypothetical protein ACFYQA_08180 [Streptomyces sp. NPDC005774]|uniref:hypothetical protein n=1 Tax=Streptomyces sp. NPDC005774 TaxID=3364728 RepID=UPI0036906C86
MPDPLTEAQAARRDYARRDLDSARAADLAQLPADGLILLVERLRTRLDDTLNLVDEVTNSPPS